MAETKKFVEDAKEATVEVTEVERLTGELDAVKKQFEELQKAYQTLGEKYNKLFNLFATTVDVYLGNTKQQ